MFHSDSSSRTEKVSSLAFAILASSAVAAACVIAVLIFKMIAAKALSHTNWGLQAIHCERLAWFGVMPGIPLAAVTFAITFALASRKLYGLLKD